MRWSAWENIPSIALGAAGILRFVVIVSITGGPLRRDLVLDVFRAAWAKAAEEDIPLQPDEDDGAALGAMVDKGVSMLHAFYEQAGTPVVEAVEHAFTITLHDLDTGEPLEEQLVGSMDLLIREEGRVVVVEHKTAARKFTEDQLRYDFQPTAYQIAARESGIGEVALRFQIVTKAKVPAVQIADIHRDDQAEADFVRTATGVLRAIDAGCPTRSGGGSAGRARMSRRASEASRGQHPRA